MVHRLRGPMNKVFNLTHKENIKETREAITPIADTVKLVSQNISLRNHQEKANNDPEEGKSDLTNSGNLVKLLQHRVKVVGSNLKNQLQNTPLMPRILLFFYFLWYSKAKCNIYQLSLFMFYSTAGKCKKLSSSSVQYVNKQVT